MSPRRPLKNLMDVRLPVASLVAVLFALVIPSAAAAATCADYSDQAEAQAAADTRDGDGDYCESSPCPCAGQGGGGSSSPPPAAPSKPSCVLNSRVQPIGFSKTKYPNIRQHYKDAVGNGWPRILVVDRRGSAQRRDRLLDESGLGTMPSRDRDEYPPATGRGRGSRALTRGINPRGWRASVRYVPSGENRSHGSVLGAKLRRFCDGQKFRYVFY